MKKMIFVVTCGLIIIGSASAVEAMSIEKGNYIDINNDGICDNKGNNSNYVDENKDSICDNKTNNNNYKDENNDSVCDNKGQYKKCQGCQNRG